MPNRTDHTVKKAHIDRESSINSFAMLFGSAVAGFGALSVMLFGGAAGTWLGAGILTILIILNALALIGHKRTDTPPVVQKAAETHRPVLSENDPVLMLSVSNQGRIRALHGNPSFLPGVKIGRVMDAVLAENDIKSDQINAPNHGVISIIRSSGSNGEVLLLLPKVDGDLTGADELRDRTQFFASLGHDLKSPLNGIIGFADIMDAELRGPIPEAYRDYPSLIRESGETLLRLVEDILGYAKAEAGTYELDLSPIDLAASGESVFRQSEGIAELAGIELKMHAPGEVLALADAGAVRRIWDNLVSNAIKYASSGDTVKMHAFAKDGTCYLSVRDTGAGMDADDLARIAKPFAQGRNSKGRAGTGLGLAMVQRLAELQGGRVKIETALGAGTHVLVSLPAYAASQKRAAE